MNVVEQMLDVTEMHLPKNVKTPRVLLPGMAEMMEHVEWNMFFVISQQKVNVSAPPPLPKPFTFVLRRRFRNVTQVFGANLQIADGVKAEVGYCKIEENKWNKIKNLLTKGSNKKKKNSPGWGRGEQWTVECSSANGTLCSSRM